MQFDGSVFDSVSTCSPNPNQACSQVSYSHDRLVTHRLVIGAQSQVGYSSSQIGYSQVGFSQVGYSQVGYSPQVGYMVQKYDITKLLSTAGWLLHLARSVS